MKLIGKKIAERLNEYEKESISKRKRDEGSLNSKGENRKTEENTSKNIRDLGSQIQKFKVIKNTGFEDYEGLYIKYGNINNGKLGIEKNQKVRTTKKVPKKKAPLYRGAEENKMTLVSIDKKSKKIAGSYFHRNRHI